MESSLWKYLRRNLSERGDICRHEDKVTPGVPDVSFTINGVSGWIELKTIDVWPKRQGTKLRVRHLTQIQIHWLQARGQAGGNTWVFLRVAREYFLFDWRKLHSLKSGLRSIDLPRYANKHWVGKVDWVEFTQIITKSNGDHSGAITIGTFVDV